MSSSKIISIPTQDPLNTNGRKVIYMKLHTEFFVVNLGPIPTTVATIGSGVRYQDLVMVKTADGVLCTASGDPKKNGKKHTFLIPFGNIMGMEFEPEA